jgi:general bacterial porin, GBP family
MRRTDSRHATGVVAACLATLALGAAGSAEAVPVYEKDDMHVDLYGILDVGLGYLEHSYPGSPVFASTVNPYNLNSSPDSFTGLYTGGVSMSRVGIRGEAKMDSGLRFLFRFESAINVTSGELSNNGKSLYNDINGLNAANGASAINGQLFSRAAYAGVGYEHFGTLQLGRTENFSFNQVVEYDPVQAALLFSPLGFSGGIGGGLGATENTRLDNSLKYENALAGVHFGLQYKFKGDPNSQAAGHGYVAMLGYSAGPLSLKGTFSEMTNVPAWGVQYSNVVAPDPNLQIENTKGYMLSALYKLGEVATLKAGYENIEVTAPSDRNLTHIQNYFGLLLPKPAVNVTGEQELSLWWVGGDYKFTPAFDLGVGFYDIDTYNHPEVGKDYAAQAGSLLADYTFNKAFDAYVGIMVLHYTGPGLEKKKPVVAYDQNALYGVGLRIRF